MKDQKGFSLIEVVIAIGLLGIIAAGFLGALGTASKVLFIADERATAESLARSQMEYVKSQSFNGTGFYWPLATVPANYTINLPLAENVTGQAGLQRIKVTVYHNTKPIITADNCTLAGYKGDR